ncbi:MAG: methyltransferase domain-containing protein [Chloroflexi bacterium]|nr:methyltransferase domain-containing protein [Chloroflexota bacterium]
MEFTLPDLDFLTSEQGQRVLQRLAREDISDTRRMRVLTALRKELNMTQAAAALETALLRKKAVEKFGAAAQQMFFTREALEQASSQLVRGYRAKRYFTEIKTGSGTILDVCCGIGSDALAFAELSEGHHVIGLDWDLVRVRMAALNAAACGLTNVEFSAADVTRGIPAADLLFFDPARRTDEGKRIFDVEGYEPPLSLIQQWTHIGRMIVKLAPGVDVSQLKPYGGAVEFISVSGELKEAVLWRGFGWQGSQATVIRHDSALHLGTESQAAAPVGPPQRWLCEPDPAVLRAGLVQALAARFGGTLLDDTIAYFTTAERPQGEWAGLLRAWQILDWIPFNLKKLISYLRAEGVGHITIKKRGVPMTPDELLPRIKLEGEHTRTLVLTRHGGDSIVLICADYGEADA